MNPTLEEEDRLILKNMGLF